MASIEIKAFVPAQDFDLSRRFYADMGFEEAWASQDLAYFRTGQSSFLLQRFFVKEHAHNFMMHLLVEDVDSWWTHITAQKLATKYKVSVGKPADQPWGLRDFTVTDPSGVLWRIGQDIRSVATGS